MAEISDSMLVYPEAGLTLPSAAAVLEKTASATHRLAAGKDPAQAVSANLDEPTCRLLLPRCLSGHAERLGRV